MTADQLRALAPDSPVTIVFGEQRIGGSFVRLLQNYLDGQNVVTVAEVAVGSEAWLVPVDRLEAPE